MNSKEQEAADLVMLIMKALQEFSKTGVNQCLIFDDAKITIERLADDEVKK